MPAKAKKTAGGPTISITRLIDATRERVWRAWTEPEQVKRWWGPKGFTTPVCEIDFRVGGRYLYCMRSPDGKDYWGTGVYREIVPLRRIVATDSFADETGRVVPATHYGMNADMPLEMLVTITFEDQGGKTRLTLEHAGIPAGPDSDGARTGWSESFDKLADLVRAPGAAETRGIGAENPLKISLPSDREIVMTRVLAAPRDRVWKAFTDPKAIAVWWGPRGVTTRVDKMDVRPGGAWRFVGRDPDGREDAFRGVYREVVPPERIVQTFEWEGLPGHVLTETATFEERTPGQTTVTVRSVFETREDRDGMLQSGMERGARESYDKLEELLMKGS